MATTLTIGERTPRMIVISTNGGPERRYFYKCRAARFIPTESRSLVGRNVTHIATGLAAAKDVSPRLAEILSVIFEKLFFFNELSDDTRSEMQQTLNRLPPEVKAWVKSYFQPRSSGGAR